MSPFMGSKASEAHLLDNVSRYLIHLTEEEKNLLTAIRELQQANANLQEKYTATQALPTNATVEAALQAVPATPPIVSAPCKGEQLAENSA